MPHPKETVRVAPNVGMNVTCPFLPSFLRGGGGGGEKIKEKEKKRRMNHVLVRVGARRSNHCRCLRFDAGGRVPGEAGWWFLGTGRFFQRGWGI